MKLGFGIASSAAALCCVHSVDAFGDSLFANAIFNLFSFGKQSAPARQAETQSRFMATDLPEGAIADQEDDLKAQFEVLNTDRYDQLMLRAKHKKSLSKKIVAAGQRVRSDSGVGASGTTSQRSPEAEYDFSRAAVLDNEANLLYQEAQHIKNLVQEARVASEPDNEAPDAECDILKLGPLKFVPQPDELLSFKDNDTMGQITGSAFTVHYKKQLKHTFFWQGVELPIRSVEDSPNCFAFKYRGSPQVFCASSKIAKDSWIDAASEAWFCRNMGIKGTLPSVKAAKKEVKKSKGFLTMPKLPTLKKKKNKGLVNVDVEMDDKKKIHVKVNGKPHPAGKRVKITAGAVEESASKITPKSIGKAAKSAVDKLKEDSEKMLKKAVGKHTADEEEEEEEGEEED